MVHVLGGCSIDELTRCHFGSSPGHRLSFLLPPSRPNVSESHPLLSPTLELSDLSDLTTSPYAQETSVKLRRLQEGNACPTERRKRCGFFLNGACQSRVSTIKGGGHPILPRIPCFDKGTYRVPSGNQTWGDGNSTIYCI